MLSMRIRITKIILDNNLLNNNKKLTSQCAPCSSAPIIILQERILTRKGTLSVNPIG